MDPRKRTDCDPIPAETQFEQLAPIRPAAACDPVTPLEEKEFQTPAATPGTIEETSEYPGPVPYFNTLQTASCSVDWPANSEGQPPATGGSTSVAAETLRTLFYFQNARVLTSLELKFIAVVMAGPSAASVVAALTGDLPSVLARLLNISATKAYALCEFVSDLQDQLDEQAKALAVALLDCVWENSQQVVSCETPFPVGTYGTAISTPVTYASGSTGNPVTVEVGNFSSPTSQAAADTLAVNAGLARLLCRWGNDSVTRLCSATGLDNLDPGDPNPGGTGPALPAETLGNGLGPLHPEDETRRRINSATVAASTFVSLTSKADANAVAEAAALAGLDCFYLNPEIVLHCESDSGTAIVDEFVYEPGTTGTGNPVQLPRQTVASPVSWADAETQAEILAAAFLDCRWTNREMTYACDDLNSDVTEPSQIEQHVADNYPGVEVMENKAGRPVSFSSLGVTVEMYASPLKSAPYSFTIEAGEVISSVSQEEADELAAAFALSQLACIYCNPRINPVCVYPPYLGSAESVEDLDLPIPLGDITDPWSMDATLGVPGIRYAQPDSGEHEGMWQPVDLFGETLEALVETFICSSDPFEAATLADFSGLIPARDLTPADRNENCRYGNDRIYSACRSTEVVPAGYTAFSPGHVSEAYFSPNSTSGYLMVAEETIQADTKEAANAIAEALALSQLDCFFESPPLELYCGADSGSAGSPGGPSFPSVAKFTGSDTAYTVYGDGTFGVFGDVVHPTSTGYKEQPGDSSGESTPVLLPYGFSRTYVSPADAMLQALFGGLGQLNCFFLNDRQEFDCPGYVPGELDTQLFAAGAIKYGAVEAGLFTSLTSQDDADAIASLLAEAAAFCLYTHPTVYAAECTPPQVALNTVEVTTNTFTSLVSEEEATTIAEAMAASMVACSDPEGDIPATFSSPFGVGSAPNSGGCCKINMDPGSLTELTTLWACITATPTAMVEQALTAKAAAFEQCATSGFIYLQVQVDRIDSPPAVSPDLEWFLTSGGLSSIEILWATSPPVPHSLTGGIHTVTRVIAEIVGSAADCSDVQVLQAVSAPQKITTTLDYAGNPIPIIVDLHTPVTVGGGGTCFNLAVTYDTGTSYLLSGGSVGDLTIDPDTLTLSVGDKVYVHVERTGDGPDYTATVESGGTVPPSTDTDKYRLIATIGASGVVTQNTCGPVNVDACRNWYDGAGEHTLTLS